MIQANELRVGNWVDINVQIHPPEEKFWVKTQIELRHFKFIEEGSTYYGIPITPEILEKIGFELYDSDTDDDYPDFIYECYRKWKGKHIYYSVGNTPEGKWQCIIARQFEEPATLMEIDADSFVLCDILYLHQLQNLYFALTGEELVYNL